MTRHQNSSAIQATRRQTRELVDGTLEVRIHIEPRFKADFHRLFPEIDMPMALAPLNANFEQMPAGNLDVLKGGSLAKFARRLCDDPDFQQWLFARCGSVPDPQGGISASECAARVIRDTCGINSRAELDHNLDAAAIFHKQFRKPWNARRA